MEILSPEAIACPAWPRFWWGGLSVGVFMSLLVAGVIHAWRQDTKSTDTESAP